MTIHFSNDLWKLLPDDAVIAEIGVAEGLRSWTTLKEWPNVSKLYMVDAWETIPGVTGDGAFPMDFHNKNYKAAKERMAEFGDKAVFLKGLSVEMAKQIPNLSLDMVFLDAGHEYNSVINDLFAWFPKVKFGGVISGHDYHSLDENYGVIEAVETFCKGRYEINVMPENSERDQGFYFIKK